MQATPERRSGTALPATFLAAVGALGATALGPAFVAPGRTAGQQLSALRGARAAGELGVATTGSTPGWSGVDLTVFASAAAAAAVGAVAARGARSRHRQQRAGAVQLSAARLFGAQSTRSPLVNWYCYEAGIDLEMKGPKPSPHPFGQVPHLSDDGGVEVFESGAILLYLADKYGGLSTPEARAKVTKWVMWANSTLEELCFGAGFSGPVVSRPDKKAMDVLNKLLGESEWLVDGQFSVADVAVASYLNYIPVFFGQVDLKSRPNVAKYMKRCAERPAFAKAFGAQHVAAVRAQVLGA